MTIFEARRICSDYYCKTNPTEEDTFLYTEALRYLIEEKKDSDYMVELGSMYYESRQFDLALKYYEMAAEYNNRYAISNLGISGITGVPVKKITKKRFSILTKLVRWGISLRHIRSRTCIRTGTSLKETTKSTERS